MNRAFEVPKVRLIRHHNLMQDYQQLHMDTEARRKRLQTLRDRKTTLMAEVRFLRRRYRHLRQDQPVRQTQDVKMGKGRSNGGKKSKTHIQMMKVSTSNNKRSEAETKHVSLPDLNHSGNETKTSLEKRVPLFDLNQISGEEEEETETLKNTEERMRLSSIEMQQKKKVMKLLSCRNGGNGSNKRKISWQDPVAPLRV
ncbi:unnamed protein product [Eruca vesicaria subsp. sativa]|uniref:Uncharacterized protein n=1 Tax=Eruca vesicaria subsp. sativa TaxID=29727 RepID=A0ABC8LSA2_ERUVS|nr:unnamed protein product [Eruca vesicaria subsp. sativa]